MGIGRPFRSSFFDDMDLGDRYVVDRLDSHGSKHSHSHALKKSHSNTPTVNGNPNPKNCCISQSIRVGRFLIVEINYPDCTNFEGKKILVYLDLTLEEFLTQKNGTGIDPHFSNNPKILSPIARFVPTKEGWSMAIHFAQHII
jgi:hypothetical protein